MGLKQTIPPNKEFMAENIPIFWEFIKEDFNPDSMIKYGSEKGVYIYKRDFSQEDKENQMLQCKLDKFQFEEEKINNKRKDKE